MLFIGILIFFLIGSKLLKVYDLSFESQVYEYAYV